VTALCLHWPKPKGHYRPMKLRHYKWNRQPWTASDMLKSMLNNLVKHDTVKTTFYKARALRMMGDYFVRECKRGGPKVREKLRERVTEDHVVDKALADFPIRFADRHGYFTRVTPLMNHRRGDGAEMAIVEFVDKDKSFDRLYPPMASYHQSPTLKNIMFKMKKGRWSDEDPNYDPVLVKATKAERFDGWMPSDDEVPGQVAKMRVRKGKIIGQYFKRTDLAEDTDDVAQEPTGDREVYNPFEPSSLEDAFMQPPPPPRKRSLRLREY